LGGLSSGWGNSERISIIDIFLAWKLPCIEVQGASILAPVLKSSEQTVVVGSKHFIDQFLCNFEVDSLGCSVNIALF
jgi:hypothetical protein